MLNNPQELEERLTEALYLYGATITPINERKLYNRIAAERLAHAIILLLEKDKWMDSNE